MEKSELSLADNVCLAIVAAEPTHGWAIVQLLKPVGELGRIWTLSRPLTYRAIDRLVEFGLVTRSLSQRRAELRATVIGCAAAAEWLNQPVVHIREIRTAFLLKLKLRARAGMETGSLVRAQQQAIGPALLSLAIASDGRDVDPVALWRRHTAAAAANFLDDLAYAHRAHSLT